MKKIYFSFLFTALAFSGLTEAQDVQWMTSTLINYSLNPEMPQQPTCVSANRVYAARMADYVLNYNELFSSMAIDCYDFSGTLMWSFPIGDSVDIESITSDPSGNVIIGGEYMETMHLGSSDSLINTSFGFNINLFLFSLDASGNLLWKRNVSLTHPDGEEISYLETDPWGNCWYGLVYFDSTSIKKLDTGGNDLQSHLIYGTRSMHSFSFDPMGNLYITGSTGSLSMNIGTTSVNVPEPYMMFVARIDAAGNCNWIKVAHDVTFNSPHIAAMANGDAILGGNLMDSTALGTVVFRHPQWVYDIFLARLDSTGNFSWGVQVPIQQSITGDFYRGKNNFFDVDASGNIYMSGTVRGIVDWGNGVISDAGSITSENISIVSFDGSGVPRWQITSNASGFISSYSVVTTGVDECYVSAAAIGQVIFDSVITNQGNDLAFILGKIGSSTGINEKDLNGNLVLYPNPVDRTLYVNRYKLIGAAQEVSIFNAVGEKMKSISSVAAMNSYTIDVSKLPDGIYFLSAGDVKKKFIVQR